ncbi:hypothetical protein [Geodermatophilus chilensis]|uniref:hypothetical protein n=1 Tax=Geodermatophilus chilensis TaxID=2035835 RepID=UPI000C25C79B|nr:hypothetical protein [Geodermatophilus chilensis]
MDGLPRSSPARRLRARASRAALVAVIALIGLVASPGAASAAGTVEPFMDCYVKNADRSRTLVLGYTSGSATTRDIPVGSLNSLTPSGIQGAQPTRFEPGTVHAAFTVRLTEAELRSNPGWVLDGSKLEFQSAVGYRPVCPASTELPEEGNGTGPAIGLAVAGAVGAVLVHRANRRARALAAESRDDA